MIINKVEEKIKIDKELLSALPKNNKKNKLKYIEDLKQAIVNYKSMDEKVLGVLKRRYQKFSFLSKNEETAKLKKELVTLEYKTIIANKLNSPYEKTGLDKIIYDISKYYKGNLEKVNMDIYLAIKIFEDADINLTSKDFIYTDFTEEYMKVFFEERSDITSEILKRKFEEVYWKKPDIIKYIQFNLRHLYYKYEDKFEQFVENEQNRFFVNNVKEIDIFDEYLRVKHTYENMINKDEFLFLKRFSNNELKLADFDKTKIDALIKSLLVNANKRIKLFESISKLNNTIREYKNYYQYKFILDDIKTIILESEKEVDKKEKKKTTSKSLLKEIKSLEDTLENDEKKSILDIFKKKETITKDEKIDKLQDMYAELDTLIFKERVLTFLNKNSKMIEVFKLASSYHTYISRLIKTRNPEISDEEIHNSFEDVRGFLLNLDHTLITNLNLFEEQDISMIISDKYILDNLNISMEMLKEENLDTLIEQTKKIINYLNVGNLEKLDIEGIEEFLKIGDKFKIKS